MKIISLFIFTTLLTIKGSAQKVVKNETDKFTKQHRVSTDMVVLKSGFGTFLNVRLRSVDSSYFIIVGGGGQGADVIGSDDQIIFLLDNDSTITAYSTGIQSYDVSVSSGITHKKYSHQYRLTKNDILILSAHEVKSVRKYGSKYYNDIDIKGKNAGKLAELSKEFLKVIK